MNCPKCNSPRQTAQAVCERCGQPVWLAQRSSPHQPSLPTAAQGEPQPPLLSPPSLADRYPLREFLLVPSELVGWPARKVIRTLGPPDERSAGHIWPPLPKYTPDVSPNHGQIVWDIATGEVQQRYVFGMIPQAIVFPTPYQIWTYHNVRGFEWLLYMTHNGSPSVASPKLTALDNSRRKPKRLGLLASLFGWRLAVAEVNSYASGAVF